MICALGKEKEINGSASALAKIENESFIELITSLYYTKTHPSDPGAFLERNKYANNFRVSMFLSQ